MRHTSARRRTAQERAFADEVAAFAITSKRAPEIVRLYLKQGGCCHYCGEKMLLDRRHKRKPLFATRDHVVPRCDGGRRNGNLVAACRLCNNRKGHMDYQAFVAMKTTPV